MGAPNIEHRFLIIVEEDGLRVLVDIIAADTKAVAQSIANDLYPLGSATDAGRVVSRKYQRVVGEVA